MEAPQRLSQATNQAARTSQLADQRLAAVRRWPGLNYVGVQGYEFIFRKAGYQIGKAVTFHIAEIGVYRGVSGNTDRAGHHSMRNLRAVEPALIRVTAHDGPYFTVEALDPLRQLDSGLHVVEGDPQPQLFEDQAAALADQLAAAAIAGAIEFNCAGGQDAENPGGAIELNRAGGEDAENPGSHDEGGAIEFNRADSPSNSDHTITITTDNPICARPSPSRDNGTGAIELNRAGQPLPSRTEQLARKQRQVAETQANEEPSHVNAALMAFIERGPQNVAAEKATWERRIIESLKDPNPNGPGSVNTAVIAFLASKAAENPKTANWLSNVLQRMMQKHGSEQSEAPVLRRRAYLSKSYIRKFPNGLEGT